MTLPVLRTVAKYEITAPTAVTSVDVVDLTTPTEAVVVAGTVTVADGAVTAGPIGGSAWPCATLLTEPASRSAWVTVWVAEHSTLIPGATVPPGQNAAPPSALASATAMLLSVTFPVFLTTIL